MLPVGPSRSVSVLVAGALWLLLAAVTLACSEPTESAPPSAAHPQFDGDDCLVIVLDALAAPHLGCYGEERRTSRNIDALARRGVRFEHAWSQTAWTLPSTASLMTGLYQETHGVREDDRLLGEQAWTMAEAFAAAGYECLGFSQNPFASPTFGIGQGFERYEDYFGHPSRRKKGLLADDVIAALGEERPRPPRFVYAHFRRPHAPYDPPERFARRFVDEHYEGRALGHPDEINRHNSGKRPLDAADVAHMRDLYQGGIAAVDWQVGRILRSIDRERTLVVLLSDHGEAFAEHGRLGHSDTVWEEMVRIPFIMDHAALDGGRVVPAPVMSIDVLPTLADLFGLDLRRAPVQGRSLRPELLGLASPVPERTIFTSSLFGEDQSFAAFDGRWKYVRSPSARSEQLFDLHDDPGETVDVAAQHPRELASLRERWERWRADQAPRADAPVGNLSLDFGQLLQALGYVGAPQRLPAARRAATRTSAPRIQAGAEPPVSPRGEGAAQPSAPSDARPRRPRSGSGRRDVRRRRP